MTAPGALACAIDDLNRAWLILRQMASGVSQRIRGPGDDRRIAGQFSDRAQASKAAEGVLVTTSRAAYGAAPTDSRRNSATALHSSNEVVMKTHPSITPARVEEAVER